jgi:hypothetical protein
MVHGKQANQIGKRDKRKFNETKLQNKKAMP